MLKPVLQEDECAPDAYEYFEKDLKAVTGMTVVEFKQAASMETRLNNDTWMSWEVGDWILSFSAEDPGYALHRKE